MKSLFRTFMMMAVAILHFGHTHKVNAETMVQVVSTPLSNPPTADASETPSPAIVENEDDTACDMKANNAPAPAKTVNNDLSLESYQLNGEFLQVAHNRPGRASGRW